AGFAGLCLDRPDAPLVLGLLGAGFCPDCQRDFGRHLARDYGDHFQPVNYLALAREAVTQASGALGFDQLPFGRDFWRYRHDALERAMTAYVRAARDAARGGSRPFEVIAQFEALGPAQLRSARLLDAAVFPIALSGAATGIGIGRLLRATLGRRPCAVSLASGPLARAASVLATAAVELSGLDPDGATGAQIAATRKLSRALAARGRSPAALEPVAECAILYSADADLWTSGRHRRAVERAGELLAQLHVQAPVVLKVEHAPANAALVLADAEALSPREARDVRRRLEAGAAVLAFGDPQQVNEAGQPTSTFLPSGRPGGTKVGAGILAMIPPLAPAKEGAGIPDRPLLEKALATVLGRGHRAAGVSGRSNVLTVLYRSAESLDVHLVTTGEGRAQGTTLFLGQHLCGGARRARFQAADGTDVKIPLNPSGLSLSTVLPSFGGYAVLTLDT
ncbi:MAG TPA: hypothetical protein VD838_10325, partial [Anaeromyxobacteraceae bacterium]|nr:hypothetical protein [Anaeromyxobacteraceae bacterium]